MFAGRLTQATIRALDWRAARPLSPEDMPAHQRTGRRGEGDAYFYLAVPADRGELDLAGWDLDVLCFIEVKTRTTHDLNPAEAAVDRHKQ
jgi:putative endonuclease